MSLTTWTRLEPDTQRNIPAIDVAEGIAARLADPLWLLGRQWQMGELTGEDAASPVIASIAATSYPIDTLQTGNTPRPYQVQSSTPEADVEHDGTPGAQRTREAGAVSLIERLREANLGSIADALFTKYGLNGDAIYADVVLAKLPNQQTWQAIAAAWIAWYKPRADARLNPCWIPDRLEYTFAMQATTSEGRVTLTAPEHHGEDLAWYTFSAKPAVPGGTPAPVTTKNDVIPSILQIPGAPALGFWEMEDASFDAGRIAAAPTDPARLLLIESALAYAADWFLLPLRLPMASLSRIDSLLLTDTFGLTTQIRPVENVRPHPGWKLWRVSDLPYLLLPPPDAGFLVSEPTDQVVFVRDEAANLAWALQLLPRTPPPPDALPVAGNGDFTYVPMTSPPDDRIPFVLAETPQGRVLVRARLQGQDGQPSSLLFDPDMRLQDEELPDEGFVLERRYELGRTPDGMLHLWVSRAKRTGAALPAAGLEFDRLW